MSLYEFTPNSRGEAYEVAREMMDAMIGTSQRPGEGNLRFVDEIGQFLLDKGLNVRSIADPDYDDRALLVVDIGDPDGVQILSAISHSDVVGVDGQSWEFDPWKLKEENGVWFGRGVCDTHGSGVAMLLAGARQEVHEALLEAGKKVSIVFTSDEEAPSADLSYRGAKLAVGLLGTEPVITGKYFIAGEPTEIKSGDIVAMRAHKGRWLAHFNLSVSRPGHSAEDVHNALALGVDLAAKIGNFSVNGLRKMVSKDGIEDIFYPPYSTAQVTAADVKSGDYSTTPDHVRFTIDLRTLPGLHRDQKEALQELITTYNPGEDSSIDIEELDNFEGTVTGENSPIVAAATRATGIRPKGFNGGDEGEVMRSQGKEGVTIGPGSLGFAHAPNERVTIDSVLKAVKIYGKLFREAVTLG